jgi:TRAP-type C4-dicarboxylate transport system substrate-binding protein
LLRGYRSVAEYVITTPMADAVQIRMGGYGPPTTSFSRALKRIGDRLAAELAGDVEVKYVWNIIDFGYRAEDILWLTESGVLTLGYQSSSYLTDRVPELGIVDLPFLFASNAQARAAMDGALGAALAHAIEARTGFRILGWFENGFRHISNRLRPIRSVADLTGMRIRVLPSDVQARTFAALGAVPWKGDLTDALVMLKDGRLDAQENPFANTVTYGAHKLHRFHTLTGHFYVSRPVFVPRAVFDAWPDALQSVLRGAVAEAVAWQRGETAREHDAARAALEAEDCEIEELPPAAHAAFAAAVQPLHAEARRVHGPELFGLIPQV